MVQIIDALMYSLYMCTANTFYSFSQVMQYLDQWPIAEWGPVDYSEICVMSPSATQVCLYPVDFSDGS